MKIFCKNCRATLACSVSMAIVAAYHSWTRKSVEASVLSGGNAKVVQREKTAQKLPQTGQLAVLGFPRFSHTALPLTITHFWGLWQQRDIDNNFHCQKHAIFKRKIAKYSVLLSFKLNIFCKSNDFVPFFYPRFHFYHSAVTFQTSGDFHFFGCIVRF